MSELTDLNPEYLIEISGGDVELIGEIVEVFRDDVPPRLDEIATALAASDHAEIARVAHSLKGAAGSLGADKLQALGLEIETAAKAGNSAGCEALLQQLRDALTALMSRLDGESWGA